METPFESIKNALKPETKDLINNCHCGSKAHMKNSFGGSTIYYGIS